MSHANAGKITAATGMVTEDYLCRHLMKTKGDKLMTTSDNPLLPLNKDSCFGDYKPGTRGFVREPSKNRSRHQRIQSAGTFSRAVATPKFAVSKAWERGTIVQANSKSICFS